MSALTYVQSLLSVFFLVVLAPFVVFLVQVWRLQSELFHISQCFCNSCITWVVGGNHHHHRSICLSKLRSLLLFVQFLLFFGTLHRIFLKLQTVFSTAINTTGCFLSLLFYNPRPGASCCFISCNHHGWWWWWWGMDIWLRVTAFGRALCHKSCSKLNGGTWIW